jgi:hypothetical protein
MSRKSVVLVFVIYFVAAAIYRALNAPHYDFARITILAMGYAFVTYVASGILPFAAWGLRDFKASHAKSLFFFGPFCFSLLQVNSRRGDHRKSHIPYRAF